MPPPAMRMCGARIPLNRATSSARQALPVLVAGGAGKADGSDDPAVHDDRQPALHRHRAFEAEQIGEVVAFRQQILEYLRGALELGSRARLAERDVDAAELRVVHLLEVHQA